MNITEILDYIIALISEFAKTYNLTNQEAYRYLNRYKGLDFIESFYDVEHTLSFEDAVEDVTNYCKRFGGTIA